jgi:catechol 2,3-dioxygenase-like lactoylglutathione lyase family enzyme
MDKPVKPALRLTSVTIGTSMPRELARFYARLLEWPITAMDEPAPEEPENAGWAQVRPPDGVPGPRLNFEYERYFQRPVWPAEKGEQTATEHLDIEVDDLDAAVEWAVSCGAVIAGFQPQDNVRVMRDPDGHPFCLFLAGT